MMLLVIMLLLLVLHVILVLMLILILMLLLLLLVLLVLLLPMLLLPMFLLPMLVVLMLPLALTLCLSAAWFWHPDNAFLSPAELFSHYLAIVGHGAHWILNLPPNTKGLIPEKYVASAAQASDAIRRSFGGSVGSTSGAVSGTCSELAAVVKADREFDAVMISEDLSAGQVVLGYSLELEDCVTGDWTPVRLNATLTGQTVGMKSIVTLPLPSSACAVRFKCTQAISGAAAMVQLLGISLHKMQAPRI